MAKIREQVIDLLVFALVVGISGAICMIAFYFLDVWFRHSSAS